MISTQQKCNTSLLIGFVCIIDFSGLRTNGSTTYSYIYDGSRLSAMSVGSNQLYFFYDAFGTPQAVVYNGTQYRYITNLQGDIVEIRDANDSTVVTYTYDAWGKLLDITGTEANTLGTHNPLRYRGYVYDTETGLYYLQSRYYNPTIGRFISADAFISTGQNIIGNNMYTYCLNNPVNYTDPSGNSADYGSDPAYKWAWDLGKKIGEKIREFVEDIKEDKENYDEENTDCSKVYESNYFSL